MVEGSMTGVACRRGACQSTARDKEADAASVAAEPAGAPLKIVGTTGDDSQLSFELAAGATRGDAEAFMRDEQVCHLFR
ncbi:hypothetical protein [Bradyrhizobium sp. SZCCHNS3051]|uniref:hypothetical protein n=1 Tax=Bradyrhizobium sp. SZCCHNS3051 TaxID=3057320 RepID=UPI002342B607|nr:hypothetical protein [Bradyrhizobium sp. SZCCHNS3051]GLH78112.1 hypothetical protein SSBR45G_30200 [Bradyrhizobium sp. SSBR45G]GLH88010.1 hypothetical protein SSBR45R_54700 [Bradyrhizobium sp. SSBR45R]